jgi:putative ABC transport system permease protein
MNRPQLPRIAAAVLAWAAPPRWREHLAGDLAEEFVRRHAQSPIAARWWYRSQVFWVVLARAARAAARPLSSGAVVTRLLTDLVSAWRVLRRRPRFALILVTVLGASLGTSATVLAIADAYLWKPLPYPEAGRLVAFTRAEGAARARPPRDVTPLQRDGLRAEVADLVVTGDLDGFTIVDGATPTTVLGMWTSADLFAALGVRPALGRTFTPAEARDASPVALISHALWMERYGGDPSIVGRTVTLRAVERTDDRTVFTVIGVLPPRFWHLDDRTSVLVPIDGPGEDVLFFRLKPGVGVDRASARLTELVAAVNPGLDPAWRAVVRGLQDEHVAPLRELLSAVTLAVAMLLLIACANVAMLQAMRALGREQEMAIRSALGAGRTRMMTQLLAENLLLAAAAFALALVIAQLLTGALLPAVEAYVGRLVPGGVHAAALSTRVLAIVAAVSLACTVGFGLVAGARVRRDLETLRAHGAGTETPRRARLRHGLAVLQVAATLALLVGATLAMRTAWHLSHVDLGFDPANVTTGSLVLGPPAFADDAARRGGVTRLLAALQASPEIETAGLITVPAFGIRFPRPVFRDAAFEQGAPTAVLIGASDGYFDAVRLRTISGRLLSPSESRGFEPVAVIGASLAARLFPGGDAVGRTVTTTALRPMQGGVEVGPPVRTTYRVVGVAADVRRSLRRGAVAEMYVPLAQAPLRDLTLQARGRAGVPAADVAAAVARAVKSVHHDLPLNGAEPLEALIARQGVRPRFVATLLGIFATLAAVGAVVGLYAVSAWVAGLRRREVAIRLALGANRGQVIRALTAGAALSVGCGLAIGWWASLVLGRLMARELTGVADDDLMTRAVAVAVLCTCSVAAVYRPVYAMTQMSPATTLRE